MSEGLRFDRLAVHYVDKRSRQLEFAPREQDVTALDMTVVTFILDLVSDVWQAEDSGNSRSGRFFGESNAQQQNDGLAMSEYIGRIIQGDAQFFDVSKELAQRLYEKAPSNSSPGLMAVLRLIRSNDAKPFVAILKIRYKDESLVKVLGEALTQFEVEIVEKMLLDEIQKGAISPHPYRSEYDVKVIDRQVADDPARYFVEAFLGCSTKKSDEHQIKKLLPELKRYATNRDLPISIDRMPNVVAALQAKDVDIATSTIVEAVSEEGLFGPDFQGEDFVTYIEHESQLGPVDIPKERFSQRGKKRKKSRLVTYIFSDPALQGVAISGPASILSSILHIQGDTARFLIETTKDGYDVKYD